MRTYVPLGLSLVITGRKMVGYVSDFEQFSLGETSHPEQIFDIQRSSRDQLSYLPRTSAWSDKYRPSRIHSRHLSLARHQYLHRCLGIDGSHSSGRHQTSKHPDRHWQHTDTLDKCRRIWARGQKAASRRCLSFGSFKDKVATAAGCLEWIADRSR